MPSSVNLMRSQVLYQAAQGADCDVLLSAQYGSITGRPVSSESPCELSLECVLNVFAMCHLVRQVARSVL